ncbi:smc1, partial [Lasius niger]
YMTKLQELGLVTKAGNFLMYQGLFEYSVKEDMPEKLTVLFEEVSGSNVYKANYQRLQSKLSKVKNKIRLTSQTRRNKLRERKSAMTEMKEAERYLQKQYKLINNTSAQALITPENLEEPYIGGIKQLRIAD